MFKSMKKIFYTGCMALLLVCCASVKKTPVPYPGGSGKYTRLVWNDEFNGSGLPDSDKWGYEKGYVRNR